MELVRWAVLSLPSVKQQPLLSTEGQKSSLCLTISDSQQLMTLQNTMTTHASHRQYKWLWCSGGGVGVADTVPNVLWQMTLIALSSKTTDLVIRPPDVTTTTWHIIRSMLCLPLGSGCNKSSGSGDMWRSRPLQPATLAPNHDQLWY